MLYELHRKWKNKTKVIVNLGSNTTDGMKDFPHPYTAHKASLEAASLQLSSIKCHCSTVLLKFGYVGSEKILKFLQPQYYIPCQEAAQIIFQASELANKYNVKTMTILPREQ
jgi:NADP-dependent 3-hydroxy acid dehydrogenase YdfG